MNVASLLPHFAKSSPDKIAVYSPTKSILGKLNYDAITFSQMDKRSNQLGHYFLNNGLKEGDRVLVFIKPCTHFSVITFALFRAGIIPVFLDPGMGKKNLLGAIKHIKPVGLIGETVTSFAKWLYSKEFKTVTRHFNVNDLKKMTFNKKELSTLMKEVMPHESAAILFTSGGTGIPKGVLYTHHIFNTQRAMLKEMFSLTSDDVDLPGFPLFGLFTITMGMTSVIPLMNPSKPSKANARNLVQNIKDHGATFIAGSPAIWKSLASYCIKNQIKLPSVKYLVMFGAPVPIKLHKELQSLLPNGDTYTPYGATECLPVTCISGKNLVENMSQKMNSGEGTCIGMPCPDVTIKIMPITDNAVKSDRNINWLNNEKMGEICVKSQTVTPLYVDMPEKTNDAKIVCDDDGQIWHRMGDLGYIDQDGYLWFCGRKAHRLEIEENSEVLGPIPYENIINELSNVSRCALVTCKKDGITAPYLIVTTTKKMNVTKRRELSQNIKQVLLNHRTPLMIKDIYYENSLPVDGRHNIKIDRIKLGSLLEVRL
jgi:acyl-CoA synthetase (AMP-forming)/AMP-acid ligase II